MLDPCRIEVQALHIGLAPRRDQQMTACDPLATLQHDDGARLHGLDLHILPNIDAIRANPAQRDGRQLRVILAEGAKGLQHRNPRPEPAVRLRHFQPDGATAYDQQVFRLFAVVEDGFIGQIGNRIQPRDRRCNGGGAGGDHEAAGADALSTGLHRTLVDETGPVADDGDAHPLEPFLAVHRRDPLDDIAHVIGNRREVDLRRGGCDAERRGLCPGVGVMAGGQQCLRWHTAIVQAIPAHLPALDQNGRRAHLGGTGGNAQSARAAADDTDVGFQNVGHGSMVPVRGPEDCSCLLTVPPLSSFPTPHGIVLNGGREGGEGWNGQRSASNLGCLWPNCSPGAVDLTVRPTYTPLLLPPARVRVPIPFVQESLS